MTELRSEKSIIDQAEENLLHVYNRYQAVLDHGEGVYLYDVNGKKYLDFYAGIAVSALGYHYPGFDEAVKAQVDKLLHTSNYYYNEPAAEAAEKICKVSGMTRVFFTNSGTEAVEGAIKIARRYGFNKDGQHDHEIIAMRHSFHGRSMGALSVTGNDHYQEPFLPMIGNIRFADFNDLDSVKALVNDRTVAIIMESFQGEGGIYPATKEFAQGVRKLCDDNDLLLILDEIQCGMGRTGTMFYYQQLGIQPDVVTIAKALGCGLPVGAFAVSDRAATLVPGDHGTTYGGNPLVCAAACKVFDIFEQDHILENVNEVGAYLYDRLEEVAARHKDVVIDHRGKGLMQGIELNVSAGAAVAKALDHGLILISAGANIIRFIPPLVIKKEHVDEMIPILDQILTEIK
ncbi:MAG: aspartate aminotransferase family protein [Lachnospiraceae bacterium]|nr:aspartate aminotransferase family protein [Lachnospiraceae bacterium]